MKIALLGKGKTGRHIIELTESLPDHAVTVFDRDHRPAAALLKGHDCIISFLPGDAFQIYIPELIASGVPVVSGSTGFAWPGGRDAFSSMLAEKGHSWIHGSNFSLGMNLVCSMIDVMRDAEALLNDIRFDLHEVHHTSKKDSPSGTALAWKQRLGREVTITSERTGDVNGFHALTLATSYEKITLTHEALDRKLFAEGALWASKRLCNGLPPLPPGLHDFRDTVQHNLITSP
ncbi:MAG: dihydrodipicolinate reductase C-terminal domain-containing protein [Cyclonatronaceae bacterium]